MIDRVLEPMFALWAPLARLLTLGGPLLLWIFIAAVALWTLILERYWFYGRVLPGWRSEMRAIWQQRNERRSFAARRLRDAMVGAYAAAMQNTLPLIQVLIAICPLLGLLGTVTGMIGVFDTLALAGTADARAMAAGVARATIPTMAGMVIGLSGLLPINRFRKRVRVETERLGDELACA